MKKKVLNRVTEMKSRVLALDMSTKTGYAVLDIKDGDFTLIEADTLPKESEPEGDYPINYLDWSHKSFNYIEQIIEKFQPDEYVIEETAKGSKNNMSQKIVEFLHFELALHFRDTDNNKSPRRYYLTEEWRRICSCVMNKDEKKQNAEVRKQRKKGIKVCKDKDGKRIGLIGKKHVNVRRANEVYGLDLRLKDEDRADALLLAYALFLEKYKQ